jgi:hypothetical protein
LLCPKFNSDNSSYYIGDFFAFIIIIRGAIFGVVSRRSHVIIAGASILRVYMPVSTYLETLISLPLIYILDANVAWGHPSNPARI